MPNSRRGNHDASYRERRPGQWEARVLVDGRRMSVYARTRAEAARKVRELLNNRDRGQVIAGRRVTVSQYLDTWLEHVKGRVRPRTWVRYEQYVRLHLKPTIGLLQLSKLQAGHLEALYAERQDAGLSPQSVRHLHAVMRTALRRARRLGLVALVASDIAEPPSVDKFRYLDLPASKMRELLDAAAGHRWEALLWLAIHTGMREGELLGLRWQHVNLDAATVQVAATLQATKSGFVFAEPKTENSRRTISVGPEVVHQLRAHRTRQRKERLALGPAWTDLDLVFPNEIGKPMAASNFLRRVFWPLLDKVGLCDRKTWEEERTRRGKKVMVGRIKIIPKVRFHDLRHGFATLALERNVHPSIVAAALGHSKTSTTVDMYTHAQPGMTAQATGAVEALISSQPLARIKR